jgi:hypothetical protein
MLVMPGISMSYRFIRMAVWMSSELMRTYGQFCRMEEVEGAQS